MKNDILSSVQSNGPQVEFLGYALAGNGIVRATVEVTHAGDSRTNKSSVLAAIAEKVGKRLKPVVGSWGVSESSKFSDRLIGLLTVNREVVPLTDDNRDDFHMYANNMFMDGEQNIWALKKTESGELLVKTNMVEDEAALKDLMDSVSGSFQVTAGFAAVASAQARVPDSVVAGDYVAYASGETQRLRQGFVAVEVQGGGPNEDFVVLPQDGDDYETVSRQAIAGAYEIDDDKLDLSQDTQAQAIVTASKGTSSLNDILAYYKMVYARSPEYFEQFKQRLNQHAFA